MNPEYKPVLSGIKYVETRVGPEWTTTNKVEGIADGRYPFGQLPQYAQVSSGLNVTLVDPILKHLGRVKGGLPLSNSIFWLTAVY